MDTANNESNENNQVSTNIGNISQISGQVNVASRDIFQVNQGAIVLIGNQADAISGLTALQDLIKHSSDVRRSVMAFQTDFRITHEQIDRLGDYKDLHDILHRLQFYCYRGILQAQKRFPNDEMMISDLTDYALTLEEFMEELRQVVIRTLIPKQELRWIKDINLAKIGLRDAINTRNPDSLKNVVWRLNRLLTTQPVQIDALLNRSARELRLASLLNALRSICANLSDLNLNAEKISVFQSGVSAMEKLEKALSSLVENHSQWQELTNELRRIESLINYDLLELEMSWPDIKQDAESLYIAYTGEWSSTLKMESNELDDALNNSDPVRARRCFHSYQRHATQRFYRVDIDLKRICNSLRKIGIPLSSLLELIQ
jgi:hypothetical protein